MVWQKGFSPIQQQPLFEEKHVCLIIQLIAMRVKSLPDRLKVWRFFRFELLISRKLPLPDPKNGVILHPTMDVNLKIIISHLLVTIAISN